MDNCHYDSKNVPKQSSYNDFKHNELIANWKNGKVRLSVNKMKTKHTFLAFFANIIQQRVLQSGTVANVVARRLLHRFVF